MEQYEAALARSRELESDRTALEETDRRARAWRRAASAAVVVGPAEALLRSAGDALYAAKRNGRDRVELALA